MVKRNEDGERVHDRCFYCDALVAERDGVGDHFPVPERHGGTTTVPCCLSCHDMKDRFLLENWPVEWAFGGVIQDFPKLSRYTRIFLAKAMALCMDMDNKAGNSKKAHDALAELGVTAETSVETVVAQQVRDRGLRAPVVEEVEAPKADVVLTPGQVKMARRMLDDGQTFDRIAGVIGAKPALIRRAIRDLLRTRVSL